MIFFMKGEIFVKTGLDEGAGDVATALHNVSAGFAVQMIVHVPLW